MLKTPYLFAFAKRGERETMKKFKPPPFSPFEKMNAVTNGGKGM